MNKNPLLGLEAFGQSVWLNFPSRNALENEEVTKFSKTFQELMAALQEKRAAEAQESMRPR
jgi:hypothetical protein